MKKNVYIGITLDILHPGIINILKEGKALGNLTVGLLTNEAIKGHRSLPVLSYEDRKSILQSTNLFDEIVPQNEWDYSSNVLKLKPDYVIHGDKWSFHYGGKMKANLLNALSTYGGELKEIPYSKGYENLSFSSNAESTSYNRILTLRNKLKTNGYLRILEAHSALCGVLIENISAKHKGVEREFDGMWSSSLTDSTLNAMPDIEALDISQRLSNLKYTLEVTTKPIIFDADTGGKLEHFVFTVKSLEREGVSAVIIEDKVGLKKNSLFGTSVKQEQDTIEGFCDKIRAGKEAQTTDVFSIYARIESLICGKSVDDALNRAFAYVEAGVDGVMIHSKEKSGKDIEEFVKRFREKDPLTTITIVPTTYNHIDEEYWISIGVNIIIYANHLLRASYPAMVDTASKILEDSNSVRASEKCISIKEILTLIPGTK